jgi:RNA polymerase-binding transcription factor DksA
MRRAPYRLATGEDFLSSEQRERIEAALDARLAELVRTRSAMLRSGEGLRGSELADIDQHPADGASDLYEEELEETERLVLDAEERRIDDARRALADGTYGTCRNCGHSIPEGRLEAVPEAVRCLDCQRHYEGYQRQRARAY